MFPVLCVLLDKQLLVWPTENISCAFDDMNYEISFVSCFWTNG